MNDITNCINQKSDSDIKRRAASCVLAISILTQSVFLGGCGKGQKSIPGVESFHVGVVKTHLYASFVSTAVKLDEGLTAPIPGLSGATVTFGPDFASEGTLFQFSIPITSLINGGKPLPSRSLPDGRAIPNILGGTLPRWDVKLGSVSFNVYLSNEVFGLFVPINLSRKGITLPVTLSTSITDEKGNRIGKVYAMGTSNAQEQTGLLLLLPIVVNPGGES